MADTDIELIAGVWASKTMQQDELIRERYIVEDELDGKTGLFHSPENDIIHTYLEDRVRKPVFMPTVIRSFSRDEIRHIFCLPVFKAKKPNTARWPAMG